MPSSVLGHYVRFSSAAIDGLDFVDSGMSQRALGNLNHLADQFAQVRVKWALPLGVNPPAIDPAGIFVGGVDGWQRLWTSSAFDLHVRSDLTSYPCRLRWALSSDGTVSSPIFRAVLAPINESAGELFLGGDNVAEHVLPNAPMAWVEHGSLLHLDAVRVRRATRDVATIDSIPGLAAAARWLRCELSVWVSPDSPTDDVAELGGVELEEYYAP